MGTTVREVCAALDSIAPPGGALPGDPNGLLLGDMDAPVSTLLVALDCTADVAAAAAKEKEAMVVAHHPLLYHPLRTLRASDPFPAPVIAFCLEKNIPFACAHTSWDVAQGGVNDVLAGLLGLTEVRTLGADGLGRVGRLPAPITVDALLGALRVALNFEAVRTFAPLTQIVEIVAVGGGACAGLVPDAIATGAQALVTSDVRHHEFIDAQHRGFALIDAGHQATEQPGAVELAARLAKALPDISVRAWK